MVVNKALAATVKRDLTLEVKKALAVTVKRALTTEVKKALAVTGKSEFAEQGDCFVAALLAMT